MTCISQQNFFSIVKNATGYHPGPVAPPMADGASFSETHLLKKMCQVSWLSWPVFDEPALWQILLDLNFLAPASIESGKSQEVEKPEVDHLLLLQKLLHSETLKLKKNQSFSHFFLKFKQRKILKTTLVKVWSVFKPQNVKGSGAWAGPPGRMSWDRNPFCKLLCYVSS